MTDDIDALYETFQALLDSFTPADAVKRLEMFGVEQQVIKLIHDQHEQHTIRIRELEEPHTVRANDRDSGWYTGPRPKDKCWPAIADQLRKDWPRAAVDDLDRSSTVVVSLLEHPKKKTFSTRGLVVGHVQSGKTTNFTSVMAKAADRGYKLFIVLAGIHNGLRRQTQARLVQQLVEPNPSLWSQLTGTEKDFTPQENPAAYFGKSNKTHVLCVVKKNATVLRKLSRWLDQASEYLKDCPALIIDDEADQATVATKTINPLILDIMATLPKSAYVGYTATPFANVLIDPGAEDLYPRDFIVSLPKPEGHFGTEVLFGRHALDGEDEDDLDDGHDMIRTVPKDDVPCVRPEKKADVAGFEPVVTDTLRRSIEYFWLVTAARRVRRSGNPHNTMLIHTSVNTSVHNSFRRPLEHLRRRTAESLADRATLTRLRDLWDTETARVPAEDFGETKVPFASLLEELPGVLRNCRVIMDNSSSEDRLDYENGPVVAIAVGGNTLSRGLTLEGLSVSYFVRAVSAYDTLLQMGRWFGFRNGYADLPRIWMTDELAGWFRHLATVETEMRRDIDVYMTDEDETPLTFAVRLRTHPSLRVTAAAKMRSAVTASSSYGGRSVQTRYFHTDPEWLRHNIAAARKLVVDSLARAGGVDDRSGDGRYLLRNVPYQVVTDFLGSYRFHEKSPENDPDLISAYIRKRVFEAGSLDHWNIAVVGKPDTDRFHFAQNVAVGRITRSRVSPDPEPGTVDIKRLISTRDSAVDLHDLPSNLLRKEIMAARAERLPRTGLLVLYPIDRASEPEPGNTARAPLNTEEDVVGVHLVFPDAGPDDSRVEKYISADLSGVSIEDEDLSDLLGGEDA